MSNKTQLQTNNTNLQSLIDRVNAAKDIAASLPEAGSGGSSGGGLDINGIIEEYQVLAGENINAGDFVEFITNTYKALNSSSNSCNNGPSCILLENNKVFIAHTYGSSDYLYGTIFFNNTYATPYNSTINGIAKTSGADGETIEVYVPN